MHTKCFHVSSNSYLLFICFKYRAIEKKERKKDMQYVYVLDMYLYYFYFCLI